MLKTPPQHVESGGLRLRFHFLSKRFTVHGCSALLYIWYVCTQWYRQNREENLILDGICLGGYRRSGIDWQNGWLNRALHFFFASESCQIARLGCVNFVPTVSQQVRFWKWRRAARTHNAHQTARAPPGGDRDLPGLCCSFKRASSHHRWRDGATSREFDHSNYSNIFSFPTQQKRKDQRQISSSSLGETLSM